jgi:hypothetical protein
MLDAGRKTQHPASSIQHPASSIFSEELDMTLRVALKQ